MSAPIGLPPLSLSSGPAIAGGPTQSGVGGFHTGAFYNNADPSRQNTIRLAILGAAVLGVIYLWRR